MDGFKKCTSRSAPAVCRFLQPQAEIRTRPMVLAEIATRQIKTLQRMLELNDLSPVQLCYSFQRNA